MFLDITWVSFKIVDTRQKVNGKTSQNIKAFNVYKVRAVCGINQEFLTPFSVSKLLNIKYYNRTFTLINLKIILLIDGNLFFVSEDEVRFR